MSVLASRIDSLRSLRQLWHVPPLNSLIVVRLTCEFTAMTRRLSMLLLGCMQLVRYRRCLCPRSGKLNWVTLCRGLRGLFIMTEPFLERVG